MDHSPLGHSPVSSSLLLQEAPGPVPLYYPVEAMSQHVWFVAQWLSPSPLGPGAGTLSPSSALHLPLDPMGVDARIGGRLALSVSQEGKPGGGVAGLSHAHSPNPARGRGHLGPASLA